MIRGNGDGTPGGVCLGGSPRKQKAIVRKCPMVRSKVSHCGLIALPPLGLMTTLAYGQADPPRLIPFSAAMTDQTGKPVTSGTHHFTFRLYRTPVGATAVWTERHPNIQVTDGLVRVMLGGITPFETIPGDEPAGLSEYHGGFEKTYYLGVTIDDDPEMLPRTQLAPAVFAADARRVKFADRINSLPPTSLLRGPTGFYLPGDTIRFDASESRDSTDPANGQLEYAWDLKGDGVYSGYAASPVLETTATAQDLSVSVSLRSKTTLMQSTAGCYIKPWRLMTAPISPYPYVSRLAGLLEVNGYPAMAWHAGSFVRYAISPSASGLSGSWQIADVVTSANSDSPNKPGFAVVDGRPAVSWQDWPPSGPALKYTISRTPNGLQQTWDTLSVDGTNILWDTDSSLVAVSGRPAVSYCASNGLKYAIARTPHGLQQAWDIVVVDPAGAGPEMTSPMSLAVVNGRTAVAYFDHHVGLRYAVSRTQDGLQQPWDLVTIDSQVYCYSVSLAVVNGRPAIAYAASDPEGWFGARYAISNSADGLGPWTKRFVDIQGSEYPAVSLAVVGDRPAIAHAWSHTYYDSGTKLLLCRTPDGLGEWTKVNINNSVWTENIPSAGVTGIGGAPAVGYRDQNNGTFSFATLDRH